MTGRLTGDLHGPAGSQSSTTLHESYLARTHSAVIRFSKAVFSTAVDDPEQRRQRHQVQRDVEQIVGLKIRHLREQQGISQEEFAQRTQLDRSFYGRVERGTQNIALRTLCIVAKGLGVHPTELLTDITADDIKDLTPSGR
jgi:ribosome-binding protein aMBF1 (putative translation factor)